MALMAGAGCKKQEQPAAERIPEPAGEVTVDFSIPSLTSDESIQLSAYKGDVVLLDFWATWCPPCRSELPELNKLYHELKADGFTIIGMTLDKGAPAEVAQLVAPFKLDYPVGLASQVVQELPSFQTFRAIPSKFIIDRAGNIVAGPIQGALPIAQLRREIEKYL
jgi:thiol-disulfide isomerase/thioredoxin